MKKRMMPLLLLSLLLLVGCSSQSDHDGARTPTVRPESLTAASGEAISPGQISQILQVWLHEDGSVTLQAEFQGTNYFKDWMNDEYTTLAMAMGGELDRAEEGAQARFVRQMEFASLAELNETGMMQVELVGTPLIYGLKLMTATSGYSGDTLLQVFAPPDEQVAAADWESYLLDVYHLRYQVHDERTGAQYAWERSAREIGTEGQTVSFTDRSWRPLAWVTIAVAGALIAFVTWAGLVGERRFSPRVQES